MRKSTLWRYSLVASSPVEWVMMHPFTMAICLPGYKLLLTCGPLAKVLQELFSVIPANTLKGTSTGIQ